MVGVATFIAAKQGGRILVDGSGYQYKRTSVNPKLGVSYWRCRNKMSENCSTRAVLRDDSGIIQSVSPDHSHGNSFLKTKVRAVKEAKIRGAANLPTVAPRAVFADITGTVTAELKDSAAYIRKSSTIARAIQRKRIAEKGYPPIPKIYSSLDNITEKLSSTMDGSRFLVYNGKTIPDNPYEDAKRLMMFMSEEGRDTLASCEQWFVDGTFKSAPSPLFTQVHFVITWSHTFFL